VVYINILALLAGFYIAFVIGANDAANALGTSFGARILPYKRLTILFGFFVLSGTLIAYRVGNTMHLLTNGSPIPPLLIAGIIITIITYKGLPISTHQVIVCALVGLNFSSADLKLFSKIVGSWIVSPILSGAIAFILYRTLESLRIPVLEREMLLRYGLLLSGGIVAFNLGANDLPTALGSVTNNTNMFLIGGFFLWMGALILGREVSKTVGREIIELSLLGAFVAQLSTGIAVFIFTNFGMPVSTTQAIIGGVVGVGLTKGIKTANWNTLKKIMLGWILAPACALIIGYMLFKF